MTRGKPRVLFLPMDGRGMGHLMRACKLARSIQGVASCMIATGLRYACNLVPEQSEYIRIPGLDGLVDERAAERGRRPFMDLSSEEGLAMRREFFDTVERTFSPDLIVTDSLPMGPYNELAPILEQSRASKFVVFRSIPGDEGVRTVVADVGLETLGRIYDAFLIASDPRTANAHEDFGFGDRERSQSHDIGYVSLPVSNAEIQRARVRRGLAPGDRWVVCSAGSGMLFRDLIEDCLNLAAGFPEVHFDIVAGPTCPPVIELVPPTLFAGGRVRITPERADLRIDHAAADIVICHGGYNTVTEVMEGGAALIVDTRHDVHKERATHARRLQPYYPIAIAQGASELARHVQAALSGNPERLSIRDTAALDFDGCREFGRLVSETLGV